MRRSIYIDEFAHKSPIPNASRIGNIIVSGLIRGIDPVTETLPPTVEQQCAFMFAHMRRTAEAGGAVLLVSQFTLYASTRKGNRPSYTAAAPPEIAAPAFASFVAALAAALGKPVPTGVFGAHMHVQSTNDGPVTIWLDSRARE